MQAPPTARTTQPQVVLTSTFSIYWTHKHMFPSTAASSSLTSHHHTPVYYGKIRRDSFRIYAITTALLTPVPLYPQFPVTYSPKYIYYIYTQTHGLPKPPNIPCHTEKCRRSHAIIPPQLITVANGTQDPPPPPLPSPLPFRTSCWGWTVTATALLWPGHV